MNERLAYLFDKYFDLLIKEEEEEELAELMRLHGNRETLMLLMERSQKRYDGTGPLRIADNKRKEMLQKIIHGGLSSHHDISDAPRVNKTLFVGRRWIRYAAAIIIIIGVGAYLRTTFNKSTPQIVNIPGHTPVETSPGADRAILTLANGTEILLDSAANGQLAKQGNVQVKKLADGQIVYDIQSPSDKELMWNTMRTPNGGQYLVVLPDGTKARLNAASSITFPAAFNSQERKIKIDGEMYLEVTPDKQRPFLVDIHGQSLIQVLGTSFNVNAYRNEGMTRTTLIQGSVKISQGNESQILKPGQQAIGSYTPQGGPASGRQLTVINADIAQALAWKNGFFNFEDQDIYAVMRQLERWYDIQVRYEGPAKNIIFKGEIFRNTKLPDVVDLLRGLGVKCRLEEKTLVVY